MALETHDGPQLELEAAIGFNGRFSRNINVTLLFCNNKQLFQN